MRRADGLEQYRARATDDGVSAEDLAALESAIQDLAELANDMPEANALARTANSVSESMSSLFVVYGPIVPAPVLDLDYLGREVELDALDDDFARAMDDVEALDGIWNALRPEVVDAGGMTAAGAFDDSIEAEQSAISAQNADDLAAAAVDQLERVDDIERVFARVADPPD